MMRCDAMRCVAVRSKGRSRQPGVPFQTNRHRRDGAVGLLLLVVLGTADAGAGAVAVAVAGVLFRSNVCLVGSIGDF